MAPFDPYHKWLGIPPDQQPANHYRLLAIEDFELDADVIEGAAEQRTIYLRTFQTGPNSELAERLLNEVSAARVCLLDGKSKARYDTQLKATLEPAPEDDPLAFTTEELAAVVSKPATRPRQRSRSRGGKPFWQEPWAIPAAAGGIVVVLLLMMWLSSGGQDSQLAEQPTGPATAEVDQKPKVKVPDAKTEEEQQAELKRLVDERVKQGLLKAEQARLAKEKAEAERLAAAEAAAAMAAMAAMEKAAAEKAAAKGAVQTNPMTLGAHTGDVYSVQFSADGKRLASASADHKIRLWDVSSGRLLYTLSDHTDEVNDVDFSPDGLLLASGSSDKSVRIWDTESGQAFRPINCANSVFNVEFSPNGQRLAIGSGDGVEIWAISNRKEALDRVIAARSKVGGVFCLGFSFDAKWLVATHGNTVLILDGLTGRLVRTLEGHSDSVRRVIFSPDGKWLASASKDNKVKIWNWRAATVLGSLEGHIRGVFGMALSPDGKLLVTGGRDSTIKLWDMATGKEMRTLRGHKHWVHDVTFSPDGRRLASGSRDHTIKIWDLGQDLLTPATEISTGATVLAAPPVVNSIGMRLKKLSAGSFSMGSDSGEANEKPVHQVTLTKSFEIGVCTK